MSIFTLRNNTKIVLFTLLGLFLTLNTTLAQSNKINTRLYSLISQPSSQRAAIAQNIQHNQAQIFGVSVAKSVDDPIYSTAADLRYECIVYTQNAQQLKSNGLNIQSVYPQFATASLTSDEILQLSNRADVQFIDAPHQLHLANNIIVAETGASLLHNGALNNTVYKGKNVIVAVFDTGIDWKHPDFKDPTDATKSRILCIWDQTLTPQAGEVNAPHFNYGVYYTQAQIDAELSTPTGFIREKDTHGHGTHVAGTAAGNGNALTSKKYAGMAPEADIVVIKGGDGSFSDVNEINALTFLKNLADSLHRPIVLNMSLGGQFSAHDGTGAAEEAITTFSNSGTGRIVVVAAGNENGKKIHNQITIAPNSTANIAFTVDSGMVSNTGGDYVLNYLMYLKSNKQISAFVTDPLNVNSTTVTTGGYITSNLDTAGSIRVQLQSDIDSKNNNTYLNFYMDRPNATPKNPRGIWTLTIQNNNATPVTLDGWLAGTGNSGAFAHTVLSGGDNNYLIGSPGDADDAITVASYNSNISWYANNASYSYSSYLDSLSSFSSRGPRRDGTIKPDITAPGSAITSCYSSETTPAPNPALIPSPNYVIMQGTSMATPATTGGIALLLQANPNLTATQIRALIKNNALKDAITEAGQATPNAKWGSGKLDVFKAATAAFNITADNKTFKNDQSSNNTSISNSSYSGWIASKQTPNINGFLGGIYFYVGTITNKTVVEFRQNNSGLPGAILGRKKIDSANISLYSLNFIDFSDLKIPITSANDYFVVLYRDSSITTGIWALRADNNTTVSHTFGSSDGGASWGNYSKDVIIRTSIYGINTTTAIATTTSDDTHNINTNNQFKNSSNELIAQVIPTGASPVSGNITSKVWLESTVPSANGNYFVTRHYQITPASNSNTATGTITLYFKQSEFDAFNSVNAAGLQLPTGPADVTGIHNLLIGKFSGTSNDNSGLPSSYTTASTIIDPDDDSIVWNANDNRWEISFAVNGFSGFVVQTVNAALPIKLAYFTGNKNGKNNVLNWKVASASGELSFELQRSSNINFNNYSIVYTHSPNQEDALNSYSFEDTATLAGQNYYRLKLIERPGGITYSSIVSLEQLISTQLYPNIITRGTKIHVSTSASEGYIRIFDINGVEVYKQPIKLGTQILSIPTLAPGVYIYNIINTQNNKALVNGKIIVK